MYIYIYIYIYTHLYTYIHMCVYIYIYIDRDREREREREREDPEPRAYDWLTEDAGCGGRTQGTPTPTFRLLRCFKGTRDEPSHVEIHQTFGLGVGGVLRGPQNVVARLNKCMNQTHEYQHARKSK